MTPTKTLFHIGMLATLTIAGCGRAERNAQRASAEPLALLSAEPVRAGTRVEATETLSERARRIHREAIVVDTHCDTAMRITDEAFDIGGRSDKGHIDLSRLEEGGVDVQVFALWVDADGYPGQQAQRRLQTMLESTVFEIGNHADRIALARSAKDVRTIVDSGRIAALLAIEGGYAVGDDPKRLDELYGRGVRIITLTWWNDSSWADGSGEGKHHHGLSDIGRAMVRRMNDLGIIVDVSHASDETFRDVLALSTAPVIASHSNARAVCDHHRNLSDDMLRALANNGGVVGINFASGFLDKTYGEAYEELRSRLKPQLDEISRSTPDKIQARRQRMALFESRLAGLSRPSAERVVDHLEHVIEVAGSDHAGLGSDFDGFLDPPRGLESAAKMPAVTELLLRRGHTEDEIRQILGGNFLRVFEEVERLGHVDSKVEVPLTQAAPRD